MVFDELPCTCKYDNIKFVVFGLDDVCIVSTTNIDAVRSKEISFPKLFAELLKLGLFDSTSPCLAS